MTRQMRRQLERQQQKNKVIEVRQGNWDHIRSKEENEAISEVQLRMVESILPKATKLKSTQDENIRIISAIAETFQAILNTKELGIKEALTFEKEYPFEKLLSIARS